MQIKGAGSLNLHACTSEADCILKLGKSNVACSQVQSIHRVNIINVSCVFGGANAGGEACNSQRGCKRWKHTHIFHEQQTERTKKKKKELTGLFKFRVYSGVANTAAERFDSSASDFAYCGGGSSKEASGITGTHPRGISGLKEKPGVAYCCGGAQRAQVGLGPQKSCTRTIGSKGYALALVAWAQDHLEA